MTTILQKIPSPLTEEKYEDRTFFDKFYARSYDGVFSLVTLPLKSIRFKDALGNTCDCFFKDAPRP